MGLKWPVGILIGMLGWMMTIEARLVSDSAPEPLPEVISFAPAASTLNAITQDGVGPIRGKWHKRHFLKSISEETRKPTRICTAYACENDYLVFPGDPSQRLMVRFQKDTEPFFNPLNMIEIRGSDYQTPDGIRVGDPLFRLAQVYPDGYVAIGERRLFLVPKRAPYLGFVIDSQSLPPDLYTWLQNLSPGTEYQAFLNRFASGSIDKILWYPHPLSR